MSVPLITVERFDFHPDCTRARVLVNGRRFCFSVEDETRPRGHIVRGETAIPTGTYPLKLRQSPRFSHHYYTRDGITLISREQWLALPSAQKTAFKPHDTIWVADVPGFQYILVHWGNTDDDTDGCLIVGDTLGQLNGQPAVLSSRAAYVRLYAAVVAAIRSGRQTIQYRNEALTPPPNAPAPAPAPQPPVDLRLSPRPPLVG